MLNSSWKKQIKIFDERRNIVIPGNKQTTLDFCVNQFIDIANASIQDHGYFAVALSGGSTPKAIFEALALPENQKKVDWSKVLLFWSDERSVPPTSSESNYHMAMTAGFSKLPLKPENIFRMKAEDEIEAHAADYERLILEKIPSKVFDAVLLGMGEDGHTASLFPETHGLKAQNRLVIANYIPQKNSWRMTLTYECINEAKLILIYVIGKDKDVMVEKVLTGPYEPHLLPIQKVGTLSQRALWILDEDAAERVSPQA
jgi:6-phosphogluconolactonase